MSYFIPPQTVGFILRWHPRHFNTEFHMVLLHFIKWYVGEKLYLNNKMYKLYASKLDTLDERINS